MYLCVHACGCAWQEAGGGGGGAGGGDPGPSDLASRLQAIPGVTSVEEGPESGGARVFLIGFEQPSDHADPGGARFEQRVSLRHRDLGAPVVLVSAGYGLGDAGKVKDSEPALLVGGNQITVEHRFFAPSRPDPADFGDLRIWQAATDNHRIAEAFHGVYSGAWLSAGSSKGGMASVYHRRFYPDDVDGTIAYVAPQSYGDSDLRYVEFVDGVGEPGCREALRGFQVEALSRRPAMTARMIAEAAAQGEAGEQAYSQLGLDAALDFAVIELPFTFWQYQDPSLCQAIPDSGATDDEVWGFLSEADPPRFWSDASLAWYEPYYFQAAVELGYPAFDDGHLAGLLSVPPGADVASAMVVPGPSKEMALDAGAMVDVAQWLAAEGSRMLFVYGENDPYSAAAFELGGAVESARFFAPGANHRALIADLSPEDQEAALDRVSTWAGVAAKPLPPEKVDGARDGRAR